MHICQVTGISVLPPALKFFILHKSSAIARILFDGNKIAQANIFIGREEKYWSQIYPYFINLVMCG